VSRFELGQRVSLQMEKWGGRRHWHMAGVYLGADGLGEWLGFPRGTHNHRPGMEFDSEVDSVTLIPRRGANLATFHAPGIWCSLYIDVTTPPEWDDDVVRCVDLDLDIVRRSDGELYLDDEDEFEAHQLEYGYPPEIIALAEESADWVYSAVAAGEPPYDGSAERWLGTLRQLSR
jgi:hypothetical protein